MPQSYRPDVTSQKYLAYRHHTIKRFKERYGSRINFEEYLEMCVLIIRGQKSSYMFMRNLDNGYEECYVNLRGKWFPVVFDRENNIILTVLPVRSTQCYWQKLEEHKRGLLGVKNKIVPMIRQPTIYDRKYQYS